ncbi:hypothetical protein GCM10009715_19180 [Paeniglutamicibacter psychrophenolicus]
MELTGGSRIPDADHAAIGHRGSRGEHQERDEDRQESAESVIVRKSGTQQRKDSHRHRKPEDADKAPGGIISYILISRSPGASPTIQAGYSPVGCSSGPNTSRASSLRWRSTAST